MIAAKTTGEQPDLHAGTASMAKALSSNAVHITSQAKSSHNTYQMRQMDPGLGLSLDMKQGILILV